MTNRILRQLLPIYYFKELRCFKILANEYGHLQSIRKRECIDMAGHPIPWYSYPATEFLRQFDFTKCSIFEYGSGNSSLFWAERALSVVSIEDDEEWYKQVIGKIRNNQSLLYRKSKDDYINAIKESRSKHDIIIIDGNHRPECARQLPEKIKEDGIVILDNSDWFKKTAKYIRESLDFIQVDFFGFTPINIYTTTTSIFISRKVTLSPVGKSQPAYAIGGLKHDLPSDEDY